MAKKEKVKKVKGKADNEQVVASSSKFSLFLYKQFPSFYNALSRGKTPTSGPEAGPGKKPTKPKLPKVNLLPPRLAFEAAKRATRRGIILIGAGILVIFALIFFGQTTSIELAKQTLASAQEQVASAQQRAQTFQPVGGYFDSLQTRLNIANSSAGTQINYDEVFASALSFLPPGTEAESFNARVAEQSVPSATGEPSFSDISACREVAGAPERGEEEETEPLSDPVIGCFEMAGTSPDRQSLADLQAELSRSPLFIMPVVKEQASRRTSGGTTTSGFSFTVNSGLSAEAITGIPTQVRSN